MARTLGDHPGFKAVQQHIADASGMPMDQAGAVLASSSRNASPAAKKKNPRLKKVDKLTPGDSTDGNAYLFKKK